MLPPPWEWFPLWAFLTIADIFKFLVEFFHFNYDLALTIFSRNIIEVMLVGKPINTFFLLFISAIFIY